NLTPNVFQLQNPKRKQDRGRSAGTKRLKASHEASFKLFVIAYKYYNNNETHNIQQENDKPITYFTLHEIYKKALQKALQTKSNSRRLIEVLQELNNMDKDEEELS
ncbi:14085_t:CDS:2, partial [Gigaspora rosea]